MATAEQCQRYAQFIKTSSGQTVDDPTGLVATYLDYSEWMTVARRFVELVEANVAILFTAGGAIDPVIGTQEELLRKELDDMPTFWSLEVGGDKLLSYEDAVAKAYTLAQKGACLLAWVEDETLDMGGTPVIPWKGIPQVKPGDDTLLDEVATGAGFGAVLLLGLWLWSESRK